MGKKDRQSAVNVFLGSDSSLEGHLNFKGQARLDGAFKGRIQGEGTLLVGPQARVEADIHATEVVISGQVIGEVVATSRIEMRAPGKLLGNINAPLVVMDEGVTFEGHCTMASAEALSEKGKKLALLASGD